MTRRDKVLQRIRSANPVPTLDYLDSDELGVVLAALDERRSVTTSPPGRRPTTDPPTHGWSPVLVFTAALVVTVAVVGAAVLLLREGREDRVGEESTPTTAAGIPPASTQTPEPTTTPTSAPPATTASPVKTAVPTIEWVRVPFDPAVFGGSGERVMLAVTRGGPGFVAGGVETSGGEQFVYTWRYIFATEFDQDAAVWTSTNGMDWVRVPHDEEVFGGPGIHAISDIIAGGPGLVAVGYGGIEGDIDAAVWTSVDGLEWTRVPAQDALGGAGDQLMSAVVATGAGLVAVGASGEHGPGLGEITDADGAVWISADGVEWSRISDPAVFSDASISDVVTAGPGLVAVGSGVWTSTDGGRWDKLEVEAGGVAVASTQSGIFAVDSAQRGGGVQVDVEVWTSKDGISWSRVAHDPTVFAGGNEDYAFGLAVEGDRVVAVGTRSDTTGNLNGHAVVWVSTDRGTTWTRSGFDPATFGRFDEPLVSMVDVSFAEGGLVAVGFDGDDAAAWIGRWADGQ